MTHRLLAAAALMLVTTSISWANTEGVPNVKTPDPEKVTAQMEDTLEEIQAFTVEQKNDAMRAARHALDDLDRQITLLQRKPTPLGKDLGKTSGWVHRATLKSRNVDMLKGCSYEKIDDAGLHIKIGEESRVLDVDHVVICAGQESLRELYQEEAKNFHLIGGADLAAELDAKRAIRQGAEVAAAL